MARLIVVEAAARGLARCGRFLQERDAAAARRAADSINQHFQRLTVSPDIGRPVPRTDGLRELDIPFGGSGYVALYRYDPTADVVYILAFRHQREVGY